MFRVAVEAGRGLETSRKKQDLEAGEADKASSQVDKYPAELRVL
jgi:hypothetical protein